jgi:hypothetical protein
MMMRQASWRRWLRLSAGGLIRVPRKLPSIRRDMEKLALMSIPGVMLIVTWNYRTERDTNLENLAEELAVPLDRLVTYAFDSVPWRLEPGTPTELMIIGLLATS